MRISNSLYIRGQKTAPFRVRMERGRSVFRFKKPRALARGASLIFLIIFIAAVSIRLYNFTFFEYKADQVQAIELGNQCRAKHFLINHGMESGVGADNPALFIWIMAIITYFSQNPAAVTFYFTLTNIFALMIALIYFYRTLPKNFAIIAALLTAFSSAFTIYTNNIWAQCLLPLVMVLFQINLYQFIKEAKKDKYFFFLGLFTTIASQLHLSGMFLFPPLMLLAFYFRKSLKKKTIILTFAFIILTYTPYLYRLFYENGLEDLLIAANFKERRILWSVFGQHFRLASFDFFRYYFRLDFNAVLEQAAGPLKFVLYPLSCILMPLFACSFVYYIGWVIRGMKFFDISDAGLGRAPLAFQVSGFILISITLEYFIFQIRVMPHYLIICFPSYGVMTAFIASKLWRFRIAKILITLSIFSTLVLLIATLRFIDKAGGHPREYGIHYRLLQDVKGQTNLLRWDKDRLRYETL